MFGTSSAMVLVLPRFSPPVGVIIQAFHHRQYMGLGFGLHLLRVVQHPADGRYRNTRRFGYFFYIDGSLTPFRRSGI